MSIGLFSNFGGYEFDRWNPVTFESPGASLSSINLSFSGPSIDQQLDALGGYGGGSSASLQVASSSLDLSGLPSMSGVQVGTLPEDSIEDPAWVRGAFWYMEATSAGADELKNNVVSMLELAMLLSPTNRDYEAKSQAFNSFVESARSTGEDPRGSYDALTDAIANYVMRMMEGDPDAFGRFAANITPAPKIRLLKMLDDVPSMKGPNKIPTNTITFQGLEVRAVRDLSHVDESTLRAMSQYGFAPKTINGDRIVLHHHQQNPTGFIVEVPAPNHSIGNIRQHPFGNQAGAGLNAEQRAAFDQWRVDYWKFRATEELARRGEQ